MKIIVLLFLLVSRVIIASSLYSDSAPSTNPSPSTPSTSTAPLSSSQPNGSFPSLNQPNHPNHPLQRFIDDVYTLSQYSDAIRFVPDKSPMYSHISRLNDQKDALTSLLDHPPTPTNTSTVKNHSPLQSTYRQIVKDLVFILPRMPSLLDESHESVRHIINYTHTITQAIQTELDNQPDLNRIALNTSNGTQLTPRNFNEMKTMIQASVQSNLTAILNNGGNDAFGSMGTNTNNETNWFGISTPPQTEWLNQTMMTNGTPPTSSSGMGPLPTTMPSGNPFNSPELMGSGLPF